MRDGWISFNYILMKFMFVVNIALQILILHYFLGFNWGDLLREFTACHQFGWFLLQDWRVLKRFQT